MNYDELCTSHLRCTANICPLDTDMNLRNYIPGDGLCVHILDFLEGKETPFDEQIKASEPTWRKLIPAHVLGGRLKSRQQVREHFSNKQKNRTSTLVGKQVEGQAI